MPSMQETFDTVVTHLRDQGQQSMDDESLECQYLDSNGLKCAVGCLIPEGCYTVEFEGQAVLPSGSSETDNNITRLMKKLGHDCDLLVSLQYTHDHVDPSGWEVNFSKIADDHGLDYAAPS